MRINESIIIYLSIVPSCSVQEVWLVFSNVSKKKKKVIFYFYIIINIAYVPCHDSLFFVCVCDSFLHFSIASQKKKKIDDRLF